MEEDIIYRNIQEACHYALLGTQLKKFNEHAFHRLLPDDHTCEHLQSTHRNNDTSLNKPYTFDEYNMRKYVLPKNPIVIQGKNCNKIGDITFDSAEAKQVNDLAKRLRNAINSSHWCHQYHRYCTKDSHAYLAMLDAVTHFLNIKQNKKVASRQRKGKVHFYSPQ